MKHKKVLVAGYFGYNNNQIDGQTIKTRNLYELLKSREGTDISKVSFFDTQSFQTNKVNIFKLFKMLFEGDVLYYLPAHNNLKYIFPFVYIFCRILKTPIHYIVIGGWLFDFLANLPLHRWMLSTIEGIYPETKDLQDNLKINYRFNNVKQLHNYRLTSFVPQTRAESPIIRLVFMARVHPNKGLETLFSISEELVSTGLNNVKIDIYGPIYSEYAEEFKLKLDKADNNIRYKGVLQPEGIHEALSEYDLMLFPTKYYTEGFPGSVLDAYISGVPVIATRWKYAHEYISNKVSGIIVDFGDESAFVDEVIRLVQNRDSLQGFKSNVLAEREKYTSMKAWEILRNNL